MKLLSLFSLVLSLSLSACATAPKAEAPPAPEKAVAVQAPPPAEVPDSISGKVISDDDVIGVPPRTVVRLMFGQSEIDHKVVDAEGRFRFEGPLEKGRYELKVNAGVLHGSRAFTYFGGEKKSVGVVIAKSEPRRHRRRRRHD